MENPAHPQQQRYRTPITSAAPSQHTREKNGDKVMYGVRYFRRKPIIPRHEPEIPEPEIPSRLYDPNKLRRHRASRSPGKRPQSFLPMIKRDLPGFVNGARVSALPDTGCSRNIEIPWREPEISSRLKTQNRFDQHRSASWSPGKYLQRKLSKIKRGLPGFVNGARVSALPDTGCSRNTVSLAFAQDMKLAINGSPANFKLGNSTYTKSLGTVTLDWAFLDSPRDISKIICDVLPKCNYPMILGSPFLTATQTLSKYKHRLIECLFSAVDVPELNSLGCDDSRLHGYVGGYGEELIEVAALPDTGAERNIMDRNFAVEHGFYIHKGPSHHNLIQFANGTYQETVGQVKTHWRFESGECVPLTFEVLEDCCSDVILGDTILYDHNVFEDHAASISPYGPHFDIHRLAPFDFVKNWQRNYDSLLHRFSDRKNRKKTLPAHHTDNEEAERQETWNYQYSFGETAPEAEKADEQLRRVMHKPASQSLSSAPSEAQSQHPRTIFVPSMATAPNPIRQSSPRTSTHPQREGCQ